MKYVLVFSDGITPIGAWQAMNYDPESGQFTGPDVRQVSNLPQAREQFALMCRERGREIPGDQPGSPSADVYHAPLEPGDEPAYRIVLGRHGRPRSVAA